ncbi:MAG: FixH family protein, partial [Armatimonadota bacterium]|nr:FixH family protein [Armatimonadota bacterium]
MSGFSGVQTGIARAAAFCILTLYLFSQSPGAAAGPLTTTAGNLQLSLGFQPDPPGPGQNHLTLVVKPGSAIEGATVTLDSSMYTMHMGGPSAKAAASGPGRFTATLLFGMGGPWQVTAHILRAGQPPVSANFRFKVSSDAVPPSSPTPASSQPAPGDSSAGNMSNGPSKPAPADDMGSMKDSRSTGMGGMAMDDAKDMKSDGKTAEASNAAGPYEVSIDATPPPIGQGQITIHVQDRQTHQPVSEGKVIARAAMRSMPMGETFHEAAPVPGHPGEFQLTWPFQMAGDWEIKAEYQGSKGVSDASAAVSPGAFEFPLWAKILLGLVTLGLLMALLNMARTANGRERLRRLAQRKNWLALLILAAIAVGAWLLVRHFKAGQVNWNAMSLQMQDYTAPTPVSVQPARYGVVGDVTTYTGTLKPYVEDTISPRVTGRILLAPYPGTRVMAGQVIVRMEQPDLVAKAVQGRYGTIAASHDVIEYQDRERQARDAAASARSGLESAGEMVRQTAAKLRSARADAAYWAGEIKREQFLLAHGAV